MGTTHYLCNSFLPFFRKNTAWFTLVFFGLTHKIIS